MAPTLDSLLVIQHPWLTGQDLDLRPIGSFEQMVGVSLFYVVVIGVLSFINGTKAHPSKTISFVHNTVMCLYSLYSFIGCSVVLWRNWEREQFSPKTLVCDPSKKMQVDFDYWQYTFYLSKFYEWIDTIFLVILRGKPHMPPNDSQQLLHVFHHTVTPSIVWVAWRLNNAVGWTGPLTNSFVHVLMYAYYALVDYFPVIRRFGVFITPIQLFQFLLCLALLGFEVYFWLTDPGCHSDPIGIAWFSFCYIVFFCLFVKLWLVKLNAPPPRPRPSKSDPTSAPSKSDPTSAPSPVKRIKAD